MDDEILRLVQRLKNSEDGKDFINYLTKCSQDNYRDWKLSGSEVLRGKAITLDELISLFENVDEKLNKRSFVTNVDRI